jgi:hypothetical protein
MRHPFPVGNAIRGPSETAALWLAIDINFSPLATFSPDGGFADIRRDPSSREAVRSDLNSNVFNLMPQPLPLGSSQEYDLVRSSPTESALPTWSVAPPLLNPLLDSRSNFRAPQSATEGGFATLPAASDLRSSSGGEPVSPAIYVTSVSEEWLGALDRCVRYDKRADAIQGASVRPRSTTDDDDTTTSRYIWRDDELAPLADSLGRTRLSVLEEATEGGLVDIDELLETSAGSSARPASNKLSTAEKPAPAGRNPLQSGSSGADNRGRSVERVASAPDDRALELAGQRDRLPDVARRVDRVRIVEEGGMIALIAADDPRARWSAVDPAEGFLPAGSRQRLLPSGAGGIQMDAEVGLFQAFELATTPIQIGTAQTSANASQDATEATASDLTGIKSSSEPSASAVGELTPHRAATIPAALIISYLLSESVGIRWVSPSRSAHGEKRNR